MVGSMNVKVRAHVRGILAVGGALLVLTYVFSLNHLNRSIFILLLQMKKQRLREVN